MTNVIDTHPPLVPEEHDALRHAQLHLADLIEEHRAAAIPAMLAALVGWSVEHGAADLIRISLKNAGDMACAADALFKRGQH